MKDRSGSYWLYSLAGAATGVVLGVAILVGFSCAMARLASPETDVRVKSETTAPGDAQGPSGDVDASGAATVHQTTIGTIQLTSGWLWGPVGLLVTMVALQRDKAARRRATAVKRCVKAIYNIGMWPVEPDKALDPISIRDLVERGVESQNRWSWRHWTGKDGPERVIAAAVRKRKKEKR